MQSFIFIWNQVSVSVIAIVMIQTEHLYLLGVPNLETHPSMKACATVAAVLSGMGMASGHLVKHSM